MKDNYIQNIVCNAGSLVKGEKALVLFDESTKEVAELFFAKIIEITECEMCELENFSTHGCEPDVDVAKKMLTVDLIFCLTSKSLAHSQARIEANNNGVRFLSLPCYDLDMLRDSSLGIDFKSYFEEVNSLTDSFTGGQHIRVVSDNGTDIELDVSHRKGNCCPGFVDKVSLLGSPPDIEANIAPNEFLSNGVLVIDGSITCEELGLLTENVTLTVENGVITDIKSAAYSDTLSEILDDKKKRILAELGVGFNHEARLCGNMLIDEGARGFIHFGFGSNVTIGGENKVGFHLDFVIKAPSLYIDDTLVIQEGVIL